MRISKRAYSLVAQTSITFALLHACTAWIAPQAFAQSHLQQAFLANSLDSAGKAPFHIKIAFQLYDLTGNPSDTGAIEEWWASPGISRVTVNATSLKIPAPLLLNDELVMDPREKFLVRKLLEAAVHPFPALSPSFVANAKEVSEKFEKTTLTCFGIVSNHDNGTGPGSRFCTDPATYALRMKLEGQVSTTARNGLGVFHDTHVSTAIDIAYQDLKAITGKVTVLQSFDLATSDVTLPSSPIAQEERTGIVPGKPLNQGQPVYPAMARASHTSGSVVLHATISRQGTIENIFVIASRNPVFTDSAVDAVKTWTYTPFLLAGQPTETETEIEVNFQTP